MSRPRSNISMSLSKKRHKSFFKKFCVYFLFLIFFISLLILGLTTDKVRIKKITISGNSSVSEENILSLVQKETDKYYLWIIPTNNIYLLRKNEIKNSILNNIKEINFVDVSITGLNNIEIIVKEREAKNLWCKGTPQNQSDCYFMDSDGFIFEEAPTFSADAFPEYFGLIVKNNPIGEYYLPANFKDISALFNALKKLSFSPKYFNALNEHEYEIYIFDSGKLLLNDKKSFGLSLANLQALIGNGYIKGDEESLKKIKYVDLRFGNKINYELNK